MDILSRRSFLKSTGAGLAVASALSSAPARAAASERVRHAVIGVGGQGKRHTGGFSKLDICEVVAVCDVDPERRDAAAAATPYPDKVAKVDDYRRILDDASIDSVSIATCDHWHTPIAIAALMAGKHVYVEKPCGHNIHECQALVAAAKKAGKCVQHGTQARSGKGVKAAVQMLRDGKIGKVRMAKAINQQLRAPIGRAAVEAPPPGVNYDMWLGPAPEHPFTKNRWHYNWHWFWDYGCGDIANDGVHELDVARWGLGVGMPKRITGTGGQLFYEDDHETPDTQTVTYEYDDCYLMYEMRLWTNYQTDGIENGTVFFGDDGAISFDGSKGCFLTLIGKEPERIGDGHEWENHVKNFVECVKANDSSLLNAPIEEGAISATMCHLGNISTRIGRPLNFDATVGSCVGDDEANTYLKREYRKGYELPVYA
ncbi:MAG: Gfo/Idh/MocA family oxidoreductase [Candidatus Hydrogenedentales bacterium]|jgi:predicted dehydrogenase